MLNVKGWVDIQKLSSTIKPGSVGTVTEEIKKCMSLLQRNINVVKSGDLLDKLEDIAYETKLKFMHAKIGEVEEVFLSSDVFYIEIQFNTVNLDILTVKIALNNLEPQDSAPLLQALKNKNYDLFCNHIELYNQIYLISDDKTIKPKIYTSLIVIETFIEQSFRNYTFNHKSLVELCNNSKYGYVLSREGGQNMKLFYYINPIEALNLKSSDININDTTAKEFENSVLVTMVRDDTNVHCLPLTIESLKSQINSQTPKHDDIIMDESFFTCNATYALTFPTNPIIIGSDIGEEIQKITGLNSKNNVDVSNDSQSKLYLSALFTQFYERYGRNSSLYKGFDIDDIDWENGNVCFKVPIKANISILELNKPSDYNSFPTSETTMETNNNNDDEFQLQDTTKNLMTECLYFTLHNHCKKEVFKGENVSRPLLSQTIKCIPFTNVCQLTPLINLLRRSTIYNALIRSCFRILCNTNENVENSTAAQNDDKDNLRSLTFAVTLGDKCNTLNITIPNIYLSENLSESWEISIIIVEPITIKIALNTNNFDSNTIKQVLESLCLKMEDILKKSLSIPCLMKYFIEHIGNYGQALINEKTKVASDVKLQNSSYFFADEENENFEDIGRNSLYTVYNKIDLTKNSSNVCTKTSDTLTKSNYELEQNLLDRNDIDNGLKFIYSEPKTTTLPSINLQKTNKILPLEPLNDKNSIESNKVPILDDSLMDFESTNLSSISQNAKPNIDMANALSTEHTSVSIVPNSKSNIVSSSSISSTNQNSITPNVVSSSKRKKHSQTSLIAQDHSHNTTKDKTNGNGTQVKNKVVTNVNLESNNQNILPAPIFSTNFKIPKKSSSPRETPFPSFGAPILANATSSPVTANAGAPSSLLSSLSKNHRKSSLSAVIDKLKSNTASPNNNTGLSLSNNSNSIAPKSNIFSQPFGTSIGNNTSTHSSPLQRSLSYQSTRNNDKGAENSTGTMSKGLSNNGGGNTSSKKHLSTSTIINSNVISLVDNEPLNVSSSSKGLLGTTNKTTNPPPSAPNPCLDKLSKLLAAKTATAVRVNTNMASNSSKGTIVKGGGTDGGSPSSSSSILLPPIKMTISKRASSDGSLKVVSSVIQPASCPESGTTSTSNFVTNESQLTDETTNNTNNTRMKITNQMGDKDERKNYELALISSSAAHRAHSDEDIRFDN